MHLDTNGHVNNAQYVRMASSALPRPIDSGTILVSYRRMALLGDTIIPRVHDQQESVTVDLTSPSGATYAVVKFEARRTDR
jgi:acyl-ACP thioesterase